MGSIPGQVIPKTWETVLADDFILFEISSELMGPRSSVAGIFMYFRVRF